MSTAEGPTVGIVLAGVCWAWAAGTEDILELSHFYPFGYPLRQRYWELGGPTHSNYGTMVDHRSLTSLFLFSDKSPQFKNTAV